LIVVEVAMSEVGQLATQHSVQFLVVVVVYYFSELVIVIEMMTCEQVVQSHPLVHHLHDQTVEGSLPKVEVAMETLKQLHHA
jgi:hypothetical protein